MKEYEDLIAQIMPFLLMPCTIALVNIVLKIVLKIIRGETLIEIGSKNTKTNETKEQEKEINIDKDLKKYFNYKEK